MPPLLNGSALPSWVVYDLSTRQLTINIDDNTPLDTYTIRLGSYLNDGVAPYREEFKEITFKVTCLST
jgi:hypothetical protein